MMKRVIFLAAMGLVISAGGVHADESDRCSSPVKVEPFRMISASAAIFANLNNRKGSIRHETHSLFKSAIVASKKENLVLPKIVCKPGCTLSRDPFFVFRAAPRKTLKKYGGEKKCSALLRRTQKEPFRYVKRRFDSQDSFEEWLGEFAQGDGADGKDLYRRCDGSCSPQFDLKISEKGGGYSVDTNVICGHARDKDDNMYQVSSSFRWTCELAK